jgi:FkbM family methyltransferase
MSAELLPEPEHTPTYFPPDIFSLEASDVFVDCGAYDGDTIRTFIQLRGDRFTRISAFEPDPGNFERLHRYATSLPANIQNKISLHELALHHGRNACTFKHQIGVFHDIF